MRDQNHKNRQDIAAGLLDISAIKLSIQEPFLWSSGWRSPIYCDNRMTLGHPQLRAQITQGFLHQIQELDLDMDCIAGVATGGIPYGVLIAEQLGLPFGYVRSSAKAHGQGRRIEGDLPKGGRCLVIEDLISTGGSSIKAVIALRDEGLMVDHVLSIFSYGFEQADVLFRNGNCHYESLIDYEVLLDQATKKELINPSQLEELEKWRSDPSTWRNPS